MNDFVVAKRIAGVIAKTWNNVVIETIFVNQLEHLKPEMLKEMLDEIAHLIQKRGV